MCERLVNIIICPGSKRKTRVRVTDERKDIECDCVFKYLIVLVIKGRSVCGVWVVVIGLETKRRRQINW